VRAWQDSLRMMKPRVRAMSEGGEEEEEEEEEGKFVSPRKQEEVNVKDVETEEGKLRAMLASMQVTLRFMKTSVEQYDQ
jgi:hypothetical protein